MENKISKLMDHYTDDEFTPAGEAGVDPEAVREKVLARLDARSQAGKTQKKPAKRRVFTLTRAAAVAAALALCLASMTVGALAFSTERIVEKEVPVEVPVEPEAIDMDAIGISLILPDEWKDKYTVVRDDWTGGYTVYLTSLYEYCIAREDYTEEIGPWMGRLFSVSWAADGENWWHDICSYELAHTEGGTYVMVLPSDVQNPYVVDPENIDADPSFDANDIKFLQQEYPGATLEELIAMDRDYFTLARSIRDIRLVLNGVVADALGSTNG